MYAKYVRPAFRSRQKELGDLNATLNDNLSGIREIKAFTRERDEAQRIQNRIESYLRSAAESAQADGDLPAVRGIHFLTWVVDCHLLRWAS
ncbi:MAG: ABC transporter transmembrane domain-containing protein [Anaerolineales bacterium]